MKVHTDVGASAALFGMVALTATWENYLSLVSSKKISSSKCLGGYLTIVEVDTGQLILSNRRGILSNKEAVDYQKYSQDQADRLYKHLKDKHISSFQSRAERLGQYGGAILAGNWILSFFGPGEKINEAICINLALRAGWLTRRDVIKFVEISANGFVTLFGH